MLLAVWVRTFGLDRGKEREDLADTTATLINSAKVMEMMKKNKTRVVEDIILNDIVVYTVERRVDKSSRTQFQVKRTGSSRRAP